MPGDDELLDAARDGIERLSMRGLRRLRQAGPHFLFLHRERLWNPREQVWMGWERKRGKLEEFNRLLRGATDTSFTTTVGPSEALAGIRYVHHARFRYAAAARHRARADRHHRITR